MNRIGEEAAPHWTKRRHIDFARIDSALCRPGGAVRADAIR
ncbi:hypothetical protein [Glycomyces amatae]|nr:hypothetical protein [Glycomyces amatae]